jgi:DNA excision repair protein ERCC-6-like
MCSLCCCFLQLIKNPQIVLNRTQSPLAALQVLKKICIYSKLASPSFSAAPESIEVHKTHSSKITFLLSLLPNLYQNKHRILLFSQSVKMLNIIQQCVESLGYKYLRIDGSILSTQERQRLINLFNSDSSYFCFLLTIQVGGVGLNLTAADRVVICMFLVLFIVWETLLILIAVDPSWSTNDNQAVDRVYRIGQKKDVVVYRLICCGTVEEKMYRKQVFKGSLQGVLKGQTQHRYFSKQELKEIFTLDDPTYSRTQQQLQQQHGRFLKLYDELEEHLEFLHSLGIAGVSHHDLLFSESTEEVVPSEESEARAKIAHRNVRSNIFDVQITYVPLFSSN